MDDYEALRMSFLRLLSEMSSKLMDLETRISRLEARTKRLPLGFSRLQIVELLERHFDMAELDMIMFDLDDNTEHIDGKTLSQKTRALLAYCERRGLLPDLLDRCRQLRPSITWPNIPTALQ